MGGLTLRETSLKNLHNQAIALTTDAISLANLLDEASSRLSRMRMVSQLRALRSSISRQVHTANSAENAASYGYNQASIITSLSRLAIGGISKMASQNNELLSAIGDQLLQKPDDKKLPFGMVLVCIGSRGGPDGVGVVSVSQLARESNREEAEVTSELREDGQLLFSEKSFSLLIDKLIQDVEEGRLLLPVSPDKLPRIEYKVEYKLEGSRGVIIPSVLLLTKGGQVNP